jgi:hypothetical protein
MSKADCGALVVPRGCAAKVRVVGEKSNDPPARTPFPVTVIACVTVVLPDPGSVMEI